MTHDETIDQFMIANYLENDSKGERIIKNIKNLYSYIIIYIT